MMRVIDLEELKIMYAQALWGSGVDDIEDVQCAESLCELSDVIEGLSDQTTIKGELQAHIRSLMGTDD